MRPPILSVAVALLVTSRAAVPAPHAPHLRWDPAHPRQGTLIRLELTLDPADSVAPVSGTLAREPLHFEGAGRARHALGAIPVDAPDSLIAHIVLERAAASETLAVAIPVRHGVFHIEKLTVAPRFGTEPDSALAARIATEQRRAAAIGDVAHGTPRLWTRAFLAPRPGPITSTFGQGREFNGIVQSRHLGTDFKGKTGAPVRATNRGIVALVDTFFLGGRVVYLDHGEGLVTGYLHLSRVQVAAGDTVRRGQVIGRVGATGRVTGPHLHWVVRYGHIPVDGRSLLALGTPR